MSFSDVIKKSVMEGFVDSGISGTKMVVTLGVVTIFAIYIFFVYRLMNRNSFYNKSFNVTMSVISIITAGIVMGMQSNFVISLGMVGALSIVRFRTAIKEPMDLLFLFWSIGMGIICGARLYEMAVLVSIVITFCLFILQMVPLTSSQMLLIVKLSDISMENQVLAIVKEYSRSYKIDSKSVSKGNENLIIEICCKEASEMVNKIAALNGVTHSTIMHHSGEVKN